MANKLLLTITLCCLILSSCALIRCSNDKNNNDDIVNCNEQECSSVEKEFMATTDAEDQSAADFRFSSIKQLAEHMWTSSGQTVTMWKKLTLPLEEFTTPSTTDTPSADNKNRLAFALNFANVVAIETTSGLVLVDTGSFLTGDAIYAQLRQWTDLPLKKIIYTHGHWDHVYGAEQWPEVAEGTVEIIGHKNVAPRFNRYKKTIGYNTYINTRQFSSDASNAFDFPTNFKYPTKVMDTHKTDFVMGTERFELHHHKGETDDAIWVWLPKRKVVCTGDFFIWNTPNAGNPQKVQRYAEEWAMALEEMDSLQPELLFPGHGAPIIGKDRVHQALSETAFLLRTIVNQTVDLMNKGHTLDHILNTVEIPAWIWKKPFLLPFYDEPEFIIRNIWRLLGGWWDGNPAHLKPPKASILGAEIASLVGGVERLANRAIQLAETAEAIAPKNIFGPTTKGKEELEIACQLAQFAYDAYPDNAIVAAAYKKVFSIRSEHPSVTSLMAKGIFKASAGAVKVDLAQQANSGILSKIKRFFGLAAGPPSLTTVSLKQLNYTLLEAQGNPQSTEYLELQAECKQVIERLHNAFNDEIDQNNNDENKWQLKRESDGLKIYYKRSADGDSNFVWKAVGTVPFPPRAIAALLLDKRYQGLLQTRPTEMTQLKQIAGNMRLFLQRLPGQLLFAGREITAVSYFETDMDSNAITIVSKSVNEKYPLDESLKVDGYETLVLKGGGFHIKANEQNPKESIVQFMFEADLAGTLPEALQQIIGATKCSVINKIKEILKE